MANKQKHPTLFVLEGSVREYEDGSMLELHTQLTSEEWDQIVKDTIEYKVFVETLKTTGMPLLKEDWEEEDEWYLLQLDVAISRMRNIDALLVSSHDQERLQKLYKEKMEHNAAEVEKMVEKQKEESKKMFLEKYPDGTGPNSTVVSDL